MKKSNLCVKMSDEEFSERLKPLMDRLEKTGQEASCLEIAQALGVTRGAISKFERELKDKLLYKFLRMGVTLH